MKKMNSVSAKMEATAVLTVDALIVAEGARGAVQEDALEAVVMGAETIVKEDAKEVVKLAAQDVKVLVMHKVVLTDDNKY